MRLQLHKIGKTQPPLPRTPAPAPWYALVDGLEADYLSWGEIRTRKLLNDVRIYGSSMEALKDGDTPEVRGYTSLGLLELLRPHSMSCM